MRQEDFIDFLRTLKPNDWQAEVNSRWTIKDVVAHMVGWEKGDCEIIRDTWKTKELPWFYKTTDFDDFNKKSIILYKSYSPQKLIKEWEKWRRNVKEEIDKIGKSELKKRPDLFRWLFEDEDPKRIKPTHYELHYMQIKKSLKKN